MKNSLLLFGGLIFSVGLSAQVDKLNSASKYLKDKDYDKAVEAINLASQNPETALNAKTYYIMGNVYGGIMQDAAAVGIKSKYPMAQSLMVSAYLKGLEIENAPKTKKKVTDDILDTLIPKLDKFLISGFESFSKGDYAGTELNLGAYLKIYPNVGERKVFVDNRLAQYKLALNDIKIRVAVAVDSIGRKSDAKILYMNMINAKIDNQAVPYLRMSKIYQNDRKIDSAIAILDLGIAQITNEDQQNTVLIEKLNLLVAEGKKKEAIEAGKQAIARNPKRSDIYVVVANLYADLQMDTEAKDMMAKALELDPEGFATNYNIGINYFNKGVEYAKAYMNSKKPADQKKFEDLTKEQWPQASKYLEKAVSIYKVGKDPKNQLKAAYNALSQLSAQIGKMDDFNKYAKLRDELK